MSFATIEHTGLPQPPTDISAARIEAAIDALLEETSETPEIEIFLEIKKCAEECGVTLADVILGDQHCFLRVRGDEQLRSSDGYITFSLFLRELLPHAFIEIEQIEVTTLVADQDQPSPRLRIHPGLKGGDYGPSELEGFKRYVEKTLRNLIPDVAVSINTEERLKLVIHGYESPELLWCLNYISDHFPDLTVRLELQTEGARDRDQNISDANLLTWALHRHGKVTVDDAGSYILVPYEQVDAAIISTVCESFEKTFGSPISIVVADDSPWIGKDADSEYGHFLRTYTDSEGIIRSHLEGKNGFLTACATRSPNLPTMWHLPTRSTDISLIAVDDEGAAGEVAFGIQKHSTSGRWTIHVAAYNLSRVVHVGSEHDGDLMRSHGMLLGQIPHRSALKKHLGLSEKYESPLLEWTIEVSSEGEIRSVNVVESRGAIDRCITPQEFGSAQERPIKQQREWAHALMSAVLKQNPQLRDSRKTRHVSHGELLELFHKFFYGAVQRWMDNFPEIVTPSEALRSHNTPSSLKIGGAFHDDLHRISLHQVTASLGGLPPLPDDVVRHRIQCALAPKTPRSEQEKMSRYISISRNIGAVIEGLSVNVTEPYLEADITKTRLSAPGVKKVRIDAKTEDLRTQSDVTVRITGFSIPLNMYIGEIITEQ